jgi:putative transposase
LENLKYINGLKWKFLTRFKANRKVRLNHGEAKSLDEQPISATGTVVWLPGYGELKVFRFVATNGDTSYWVSNDLDLTPTQREVLSEWSSNIEEYHRGLKQYTGVERCAMRLIRGQRNHIGLAVRAFVRLEYHRVKAGISWFQAKTEICRQAIRQYLQAPYINFHKRQLRNS